MPLEDCRWDELLLLVQSELSFGHIAAYIVVAVVDIDIAESVADVVAAVAAYSTGLLELWLCL
jgi:hypothetical protein